MSTPFRPQTDSSGEAAVKICIDLCRLYVDSNQSDWYELLPSLEFAYNDTPGASGFSPFEICYQRNPRSAQTFLSEEALLTDQSVGQGKEGADVLRRHARVIKKVRENLKRLALEVGVVEKVVRQKRRTEVFEVGDHVALHHSQTGASFPHSKMAPIFTGSFTIVEVMSPVSYRLKLPDSMRISEVQHISLPSP